MKTKQTVDNVFEYEGDRKDLVDIFYRLLMTGQIVSYHDVLTEYDGGTFSEAKLNSHPLYNGVLKKIGPKVIEMLRYYGYSVVSYKNGRAFQYVDSDPDPLRNIRFKAQIEERHRHLSKCIDAEQPVCFTYHPFDKSKRDITLHPHLVYEYNNRKFVFGVSQREGMEPVRCMVFALDRIIDDIRYAKSDVKFIPALPDEYVFLKNIVGVKPANGAELTIIRLRANTKYMFGLIKTKPIHSSQKVVLFPNWSEGREYGEFEIQVYPSRELFGTIRYYGKDLEIVSPKELRNTFLEETKETLERYQNNSSLS